MQDSTGLEIASLDTLSDAKQQSITVHKKNPYNQNIVDSQSSTNDNTAKIWLANERRDSKVSGANEKSRLETERLFTNEINEGIQSVHRSRISKDSFHDRTPPDKRWQLHRSRGEQFTEKNNMADEKQHGNPEKLWPTMLSSRQQLQLPNLPSPPSSPKAASTKTNKQRIKRETEAVQMPRPKKNCRRSKSPSSAAFNDSEASSCEDEETNDDQEELEEITLRLSGLDSTEEQQKSVSSDKTMDDTEEQWQKWLTSGYPVGTSDRLAAPPELSANQQSEPVDQSEVENLHPAVSIKKERSSSKSISENGSPPFSRLTLQSAESSNSLLVLAAEPAASSNPSYQKPSPDDTTSCKSCSSAKSNQQPQQQQNFHPPHRNIKHNHNENNGNSENGAKYSHPTNFGAKIESTADYVGKSDIYNNNDNQVQPFTFHSDIHSRSILIEQDYFSDPNPVDTGRSSIPDLSSKSPSRSSIATSDIKIRVNQDGRHSAPHLLPRTQRSILRSEPILSDKSRGLPYTTKVEHVYDKNNNNISPESDIVNDEINYRISDKSVTSDNINNNTASTIVDDNAEITLDAATLASILESSSVVNHHTIRDNADLDNTELNDDDIIVPQGVEDLELIQADYQANDQDDDQAHSDQFNQDLIKDDEFPCGSKKVRHGAAEGGRHGAAEGERHGAAEGGRHGAAEGGRGKPEDYAPPLLHGPHYFQRRKRRNNEDEPLTTTQRRSGRAATTTPSTKSTTPRLPTVAPTATTTTTAVASNKYFWGQTHIPKQLTKDQEEFYKNYDPVEGVTTATVLGGFFVFVCLLVVYKSKLKPWYKNRGKKLTNTPASRSEATTSINQINKEFECLQLQKLEVGQDDCSDDDIFYMDEYGNYIFPVSPSQHGTCSCPHSVYDYEAESRRPSIVSALSNAYTVKSLPGAMLYIPLDSEYNTPIALKRSLSDPEIYFPSAVKHSLIVAVNGLLSARGGSGNDRRMGGLLSSSGHIIGAGTNGGVGSHGGSFVGSLTTTINDQNGSVIMTTKEKVMSAKSIRAPLRREETLQIDINVIQPTPNISPTCSMSRSISGESRDMENDSENFSGIPLLVVPSTPIKIRRVSFSEQDSACMHDPEGDDIESSNEDIMRLDEAGLRRSRCQRQSSLQASSCESPTSQRRRRFGGSRQLTLPTSLSKMSYLQVPGQERPTQLRIPGLDRHGRLISNGNNKGGAGTEPGSPLLGRRQLAPQASIESYYSIASEGDGDIFASSENLGLRPRLNRQTSFCLPDTLISQYSEFNEDFNSSISDLFSRRMYRLSHQNTMSEQGSLRSLPMDQEELLFDAGSAGVFQTSAGGVGPPGPPDDDNDTGSGSGKTVISTGKVTNCSNKECANNPNRQNDAEMNDEEGLLASGSAEISGSHLDLVDELQYEEDDVYIMSSSSCSISISSSGAEHESSHQITVPVYVEPAPPEIRLPSSDAMDDSHLSAGGGGVFGGGVDVEAATGDIVGLLQGDRRPRFAHQETMHTDSGLDTEDICPASPTNSRLSITESPGGRIKHQTTDLTSCGGSANTTSGGFVEEENLRLVLVRDIGIQCCTDSPATVRRRNMTTITMQQTSDSNCDQMLAPTADTMLSMPIVVLGGGGHDSEHKNVAVGASSGVTNSSATAVVSGNGRAQQNSLATLARGHSDELLF